MRVGGNDDKKVLASSSRTRTARSFGRPRSTRLFVEPLGGAEGREESEESARTLRPSMFCQDVAPKSTGLMFRVGGSDALSDQP
jgi:hypothetical protein